MTSDPFDSAAKATLAPQEYFGEIQVDAYFVRMAKGEKPIPFAEGLHPIEQRRTMVMIQIIPIPEQNITGEVYRKIVAESNEWVKVVWPSAQALGISNPRELKGRFAQVKTVPSGRTYEKDGQTVQATTFQFVRLFTTQGECAKAFTHRGETAPEPLTEDSPAFENGGTAPVDEREKQTASVFMEAIVRQTKGDKAQIAAQIKAVPMLAKYFSADSPEVGAMIAQLQAVAA